MSFTLKLQTNNSDAKCVDKTLTTVSTINGNIREATSIVAPIFTVELTTSALPTFNYITCSELGRSYFVRDIKCRGARLWDIVCEVDVLTSFAAEIRANKAIIKRQESEFNLFYNDGTFRCYQNPQIITKTFPKGFTPNSSNFVLAVSGGISSEATTVSDT